MAIEFENEVELYDEGVRYGKIGVSKRIDQYTFSEISNYLYAGVSAEQFKNFQSKITGVFMRDCSAPIKIVDPGGTDLDAEEGEGADTGDNYCKVIWCYSPVGNTPLINIDRLSINDSGTYIITNMDASNIVIKMTTTRAYDWGDDWQTRQASSFTDDGKAMDFTPECYWQDNGANNFTTSGTDSHRHLITSIAPFLLVPAGDSFVLLNAVFARIIGGGTGPIITLSPDSQYNYFTCVDNTTGSFAPVCTPTEPTSQRWYAYGMEFYGINSANDNYSLAFFFNESSRFYHWRYVPNTHDKLLLYMIRSGVYIYTDRLYKPIISGGYISGYTSNTSAQSDIDNYTYANGNGHDVPISPPSGGGNGDELLDMESRAQFYGSGITTYYVNVPTTKLKTALGNWDNVATGKDVLKNLISYKLFCFPTSTFTNGMLHDFVIAGTTLKDESNNPIQSAQLTQYGAVSLPSITIPKTFNDFRDYAPYTNLSMYIPLCGWFTLPPWCMGRTISGEMYINGYTGTLKCIVRADGNVVTELGGNASIDLPFAAEAVGMKAAAVLGNLINTAGSIASIANPSAGGVANVGTAVLGTVCALNANYTESKGTMGDGSNIAGLYHVYIKISRPATIDNEGKSLVTIPAEYKRQYGLPCNKSLTLTQGDGYTQILDANITGNMTAREKQMIIDGFRRGLIL